VRVRCARPCGRGGAAVRGGGPDVPSPSALARAQIAARQAVWERHGVHGSGTNRMADAVSKLVEEAVCEAVACGELVPIDESWPVFNREGFTWLNALTAPERRLMAAQVAAAVTSGSPRNLAYLLDAWRFTSSCRRDYRDNHAKPFDPATWSPDGGVMPGVPFAADEDTAPLPEPPDGEEGPF
jgi:hypothetical protein